MNLKETLDHFQNKKYFDEHAEYISDHLDKYYSESEIKVFHEIMTFDFKVHIYFINSKKHSFNILLTSGMSSLEMNVEEGAKNKEDLRFAELMLLIPKDIEFQQVYTGKNINDWIISMLKQTAKFPHQYDTWIGIGHTIQATADLQTYSAETDFVGGIILPSVTFDEKFTQIKKNGKIINIYSLFPLYKNELEYKIGNGYNAFLDLLIKANSKEVLDNKRKNIIPKKSFWNKLKI